MKYFTIDKRKRKNYKKIYLNVDYFDVAGLKGYAWDQILNGELQCILDLVDTHEMIANDPVFYPLSNLASVEVVRIQGTWINDGYCRCPGVPYNCECSRPGTIPQPEPGLPELKPVY